MLDLLPSILSLTVLASFVVGVFYLLSRAQATPPSQRGQDASAPIDPSSPT